jgi:hypothetical protein
MREEVLPHFGENFTEQGIADAIEDLIANLSTFHDVLTAKDSEMLGSIGLFDANFLTQVADGHFPVLE